LKNKLIKLKERIHMNKNIRDLKEFLEQAKECHRRIEEEENLLEDIHKRIDEILEIEGIDILSLSELV
jgi:hypothetical protein